MKAKVIIPLIFDNGGKASISFEVEVESGDPYVINTELKVVCVEAPIIEVI